MPNDPKNGNYEGPDVIYEGELEVQAGSPVGDVSPEWDELNNW